jgi:tripartite-type tricarboxylate transporter receptor subunit TctC
MRESGFPASQVTNQYIMMAPAKTPAPIIEKLNAALAVATKDPEVTSLFKKQGFDVLTTTPAEAAALFASERKRWEAVFKDAGIRLN